MLAVLLALTFSLSELCLRFGWAAMSKPTPVEVDGDLTTIEWMAGELFTYERRIVSMRHGVVCASVPFDVDPSWEVQRIGIVHHLTRMEWPLFTVRELPPPICP